MLTTLAPTAKSAPDWLAEADRRFDAGDAQAGSRCMWQAAHTALVAVAQRRGLPCQTDLDLMNLTDVLDDEAGEPLVRLVGFGIARLFRRNAEEGVFWEDYEFDVHRGSVKSLVKSLTEPGVEPPQAKSQWK